MNRRAMEWAARLYPAQWRRRYGIEFGALLEESGDGWGAIADVLKGALSMQLRSWNVWQFVVACALIGVAIAGIASWRMPGRYVSEAVLRFDRDGPLTRELLNKTAEEALSGTKLTKLITAYGLYKTDGTQGAAEDVLRDMRTRINISFVSDRPPAFKVSFAGNSPAQARHVANVLASQFIDENVKNFKMPRAHVEVLDPATLPERPTLPNPWRFMAVGVVLGVLLGLLAFRLAVWSKRSANA